MSLKLVNPATGKVFLEEADNGEMTIHDAQYKEQYTNALKVEETTKPKTDDPGTAAQTRMKTSTQKEALYAHNLLSNWYASGRCPKGWDLAKVKKEHTRVVRTILAKGWNHTVKDALDNSLPGDLKEQSNAPDKSEADTAMLLKAHEKLHTAYKANAKNEIAEKHVDLVAALEEMGVDHAFADKLDEFVPEGFVYESAEEEEGDE